MRVCSCKRACLLSPRHIHTPHASSHTCVGAQPYSFPTDLWAMGCVLFELLTLARAFEAPSFPALAKAVVDCETDSIRAREHASLLAASHLRDPTLPPALLALPTFGALLHPDPASRTTLPQIAAALWPHLPPPGQDLMQQILDAACAAASERIGATMQTASLSSHSPAQGSTPSSPANTLRRRRATATTAAEHATSGSAPEAAAAARAAGAVAGAQRRPSPAIVPAIAPTGSCPSCEGSCDSSSSASAGRASAGGTGLFCFEQ